MAVQTQYPLLLNRDTEDIKNMPNSEYSMFMQPAGRFLDQSVMFFNNNGGTNSRKRGRENIANLAQQSEVVSTGLKLSFEDQEKHHQLQRGISFMSEDINDQIKQQSNEIEQIFQNQGTQLRHALAEKRQKHYHAIIRAAEDFAAQRLREKEIELHKKMNYNVELEKRVMQLRAETQAWQAKARAQELTAVQLQTQLQEAIIFKGGGQDRREEETGDANAEDCQSAYVDPERVVELPAPPPTCKACGVRAMSVVLLPCRHLCLCAVCDAAGVDACPCCFARKTASVEVYLT